jgi:hypothetical protein
MKIDQNYILFLINGPFLVVYVVTLSLFQTT